MKRTVAVYEYHKAKGRTSMDKVWIGTGVFHAFGVDYQEFETGPGNFSTAIVEMADGTVKNVPVELIVFNGPIDINTVDYMPRNPCEMEALSGGRLWDNTGIQKTTVSTGH
jgi:hypothetical protein